MEIAESTSERLLAAAEFIVLREGAHCVSVRRIASQADESPALISYHFSGLNSLLAQLLILNVNAICDARALQQEAALRVRGKGERLKALIAAYMEPFWTTSAKWHPDPARTVVREVMPMLDRPLLAPSVSRINSSVAASAEALSGLLPHLNEDELLVRLRLLASAADTLRVALGNVGLYPLHKMDWKHHDAILQTQLLRMSLGALQAG